MFEDTFVAEVILGTLRQRQMCQNVTCVMLEKPMMKEMKQTMRMNIFFLFLSSRGYSSIRAVMNPSTVQNYHVIEDLHLASCRA